MHQQAEEYISDKKKEFKEEKKKRHKMCFDFFEYYSFDFEF